MKDEKDKESHGNPANIQAILTLLPNITKQYKLKVNLLLQSGVI